MKVGGTYEIMMQTPMGPQKATLVLAEAGGSLSGSIKTMMGTSEFEGGTADGGAVAWVARGETPMGPLEIECTAMVEGDAISGEAKVGAFGTATFSGQRV